MNEVLVSSASLKELISELYEKAGMEKEDAEYHAYGLVTASLRGVDSHGVMRTSAYLSRILNGAINVHPDIRIVEGSKSFVVMDADGASGYTAGKTGMRQAICLAKEYGTGTVIVRNSNHFGAAALYAQMAVEEGMVGISTTNVKPGMTAPGAAANVGGNNPFAIGIPTYNDFPFMLDMALSVVAGGKLKMAIAKGEKIPFDWATDKDGNHTDDPQKGFDGYFLPLGGFKGLGLSYAIDILCGVMSRGAFQNHIKNMYKDPLDPSRTCHMFVAMDLASIIDKDEIRQRMFEYREYLRGIPTKSGVPLMLPGEIEEASRIKREREGIPVPKSVYDELVKLAEDYKLSAHI